MLRSLPGNSQDQLGLGAGSMDGFLLEPAADDIVDGVDGNEGVLILFQYDFLIFGKLLISNEKYDIF